jgi:hypothetical protein
MSTAIKDLQEKIEKVKKDLITSTDLKSKSVLADYLDYLKDELKMLENDDRFRKSTGK